MVCGSKTAMLNGRKLRKRENSLPQFFYSANYADTKLQNIAEFNIFS
jgi:hypothetical protein